MTADNNENIFGKRLKNARVMLGISMDDLVLKMNSTISKMAICKYEKGEMNPSSSIVVAFSNALNKPIDYFFRPFTFSVQSIQFRKKSALKAKECDAIREKVSDYVERYAEIEAICAVSDIFEKPFVNRIRGDSDVIKASEELRRLWNLGEDGIVNIIELLESHGIKVLEMYANQKFDGLSSFVNETFPIIVINNSFNSERKRFTCLHELAHILLDFGDIEIKEQERLCNLFANEMLVPSVFFKSVIGDVRHDISYTELKYFQEQFGISIDALIFKARYHNIISEQRYNRYFKQKNRDSSFKATVEESLYPDVHSGRFKSLVYKALSSELITISKAASLLDCSVEDVRREFVLV